MPKYYSTGNPDTEEFTAIQPIMTTDVHGNQIEAGSQAFTMEVVNGVVAVDDDDRATLDIIKYINATGSIPTHFEELTAQEYSNLVYRATGSHIFPSEDNTKLQKLIDEKDAEIAALKAQLDKEVGKAKQVEPVEEAEQADPPKKVNPKKG